MYHATVGRVGLSRPEQIMTTQRLTIILSVFFLFLNACDFRRSRIEREFDDNLRRVNRLMRDYNKIPQQQKAYENKGFVEIRFWKDKEQLKRFYDKNSGEFRSVDASLTNISQNRTDNNILFDDAIFARAILYSLWGQIDRDRQTVESAIAALRDFVNLVEPHIEESTRTAMQESFWNAYRETLTPSLSYEENARILFRNNIAYFFTILKEYDQATKEYEAILKTSPTSKFAPHAREQIKTIKDIAEGRTVIPDAPSQ